MNYVVVTLQKIVQDCMVNSEVFQLHKQYMEKR